MKVITQSSFIFNLYQSLRETFTIWYQAQNNEYLHKAFYFANEH